VNLYPQLQFWYSRTHEGTIVWIAFAAAMVLLLPAAGMRSRRLRRAGVGVFVLATALLAAAFAVRWVLSGQAWYLPPIRNQFEAITGSALLGAAATLALELRGGRGYLATAGALYATVALLVCFLLPQQTGAQIAARHGILDSPILAAHVAIIIVGYAMIGMTFFLSTAYLLLAAMGGRSERFLEALSGIDRSNVIAARLGLWTVALGTMLGAWWAQVAWGRWWGWDPKETWALITVLIYVAVIHLRFVAPPRRRGIWTAAGCILGCAGMLVNWIVVNYLIPGLHSYS